MAYATAIAAVAGLAGAFIQGQGAKKDQKAAEAASAEAVQGILNIEEENAFKALEAVKAPNIETIASDRQLQAREGAVEDIIETTDSGPEAIAGIVQVDKNSRASTLDTAEKQAAAKYKHEMGVAESIATEEARISKDAALREVGVYEGQALGAGLAGAEAKVAKTAADNALFASAGSLAGEVGNLLGDGGDV